LSAPAPSAVRRFVGELSVIVLGVLLALAADRWNQGRTDRSLAEDYHTRLLAELVSDSIRLEEHRMEAREGGAACVQLYTAVREAASDSTVIRSYFGCVGSTLPHAGGGTYSELQSTGFLRLLPTSSRQALFDYYGFVEGMRGRLQARRDRERADLIEAYAKTGGNMPRDVVPLAEFLQSFRSYPNIEGIIMGCRSHQGAESTLVGIWITELADLISEIRQNHLTAAHSPIPLERPEG
jgi:hypothetical protein